MAKFIYEFTGNRGRSMKLYDTKVVIKTSVTMGSLLTSNATDGEKTVFFIDVVGVQFKKSGLTIGYLQFETATGQMNNHSSNQFSENTFTFESNLDADMEKVYKYVTDRMEEIKYGVSVIEAMPKFKKREPTGPKTVTIEMSAGVHQVKTELKNPAPVQKPSATENPVVVELKEPVEIISTEKDIVSLHCPQCGEDLSFMGWTADDIGDMPVCPICGTVIKPA